MKKIIKTTGLLIAIISMVTFTSCETTELNLTDDPNAASATAADPDLLLNKVQVQFAGTMQNFGTVGSEVSRLKWMFGRNYQDDAYSASTFNGDWTSSYAVILKNNRIMNPIAAERGLTKHIAIGQVIEAYTLITLVDFFGDIPYSEALDVNNLNPKLDSGKDVYEAALDLLDKSIVNFNASATSNPKIDFYYNKSWAKWIKLANTLKLKIYLQTRLVDATAISKFNAIIATGSFIGTGEDFEFNWGTSNANPDSRHPAYVENYTPSGVEAGYQANWLMNEMKNGKTTQDPRMRYYFYRQVNTVPVNEQDLRCSVEPAPAHYDAGGHVYCRIDADQGYWGRDHGNDEGIPNDRTKRTAVGVYPAGGKFDDNTFRAINNVSFGANGAGTTPIVLASTVDFWRAEAALSPGGTGDARSFMTAGIQKSITKVRGFITRDKTAITSFAPALSVDNLYITAVQDKYDAAVSNANKLDVVITEFFISLFGNGTDAYNAYRRTGFPRKMQPNIDEKADGFIRSFLYPADVTGTNPNIKQKAKVTQRVFWDNNPETGFPIGN
ncbi:SusD/RagB family nutrient-binding outer membrane lipoprotein [Flavobacterium glaciei]|uniref:SusD/RagB-like outer membrane lipoprotein n=1 Tax=Flavobacterium glaciei TaxID=386300 RepID=A0A562Q661_9FLAO|nr:SusD/RagB family nutrient-binding outer membrane lipoprotein [Flavobacterium glaciei]RDI58434.1 SusD/RagB-like outer membrane lipoprotein [Flavobacterium glaciei]TWI52219.1 SusD/RagB-like outer membrane lipoprotein [Flavobacterium glaciei]